jgi:CRISPR-associated protein Cas5t
MEALRIRLHQVSANYRREETIQNKMTYPLPPLSTVIGALHTICGYTEYHEMKISIQGKFASMHRESYTDYCFLNSTMDDRGILVKMANDSLLSKAFVKVASAKKSQGNSFIKGITIQVHEEKLLEEYRSLYELGKKIAEWKNGEYKQKLAEYKQKKQELASKKKTIGKGNVGFQEVVDEEKRVKEEEKEYKEKVAQYEEDNYKRPISHFRTLTTSLKYYEILDDIDLILHVNADSQILDDIEENIYNLKFLGRSEDFVDVEEVERVELIQKEEVVDSIYSGYLKYEDVKEEKIYTQGSIKGRDLFGTKYYLGKKYEIEDGKRKFLDSEKVAVVYTSDFGIDETSENVWLDCFNKDEENGSYIVNFL